jgi:tRNA U34 5-carboxymethylaminomethyl modifying GTPase MnmE/TrmE
MSTETLRKYIAEFRDWLDGHGTPALQGDDAQAIAAWQDDLASAERLLEIKPELPIAFLGPSQQGKSSLINALLGQNILNIK